MSGENVEEIALEEKTSLVEVNGSESAEVRSNPEGRSNAGNGNGDTTQVDRIFCRLRALMDTLSEGLTRSLTHSHPP